MSNAVEIVMIRGERTREEKGKRKRKRILRDREAEKENGGEDVDEMRSRKG